VPLEEAKTVAQAQDELRRLLVDLGKDNLRHIGRHPKFADYVAKVYGLRLATCGKKPDTLPVTVP
jgi:hypothetical protein